RGPSTHQMGDGPCQKIGIPHPGAGAPRLQLNMAAHRSVSLDRARRARYFLVQGKPPGVRRPVMPVPVSALQALAAGANDAIVAIVFVVLWRQYRRPHLLAFGVSFAGIAILIA